MTAHVVSAAVGSLPYQPLMLGRPGKEVNDAVLNEIPKRIKSVWRDLPAYVVKTRLDDGPLPQVMLSGEFVSYTPARTPTKDASALVIVWFQEVLHPIISEANEAVIKTIRWADYAVDFDW